MDQPGQLAASQMIESLNGWWELAGVDVAVGKDAVEWLKLDMAVDATAPAALPKPATQPIATVEAKMEWPTDIETLRSKIAAGEALPGNGFSNRPIAPTGPGNAAVMIVSDLPEADELTSATLGSGASGVLLTRMLAAIGIELVACYWTALATTIPSTGELPEGSVAELGDFVRFQIGLVRPKSIVLLGSSTSQALLGDDLMKARQSLANINHDGGKVTVLTTFHPRTLIARPQMKGQAWKDLQMFAKRDVL